MEVCGIQSDKYSRIAGCLKGVGKDRFYLCLAVLLPVKFFARRDGFLWGRLAACGGLSTRLPGCSPPSRLKAPVRGLPLCVHLWLKMVLRSSPPASRSQTEHSRIYDALH